MSSRIAVAPVAMIVTVWSASGASARGGGHGGGGHGGFGGSGHGFQAGGFAGNAAFAHPGGFGVVTAARPVGIGAQRFAVGPRFGFRHHFFHHRFAFFGAYPYGDYDDCYGRVWTPWGWRWQYACY
jgi:hypothetical protein